MKKIFKLPVSKRIFLLAVLIRFLVIPFFFHPDIRVYNFQASFLKEGVMNIYDYLINARTTLPYKEEFVYFPLAYFFIGSYQILATPFLGREFNSWLFGGETTTLFRYLFILKIPYLVLDILIAFLLSNLFDDIRQKKLAFILWLFNPFTIILVYFYSNIDIIPAVLTVVAFLLVKKNKGLPAGLSLALGAGFKAYPLLLLPSLLLTKERIQKQILNILISLVTFGFMMVPFWGKNFIESSFSSGLTNRIFENGINIGLERKIPYFIILYIIAFIYIYFRKKGDHLPFYLLATLMLLATTNYHIQWLLWFMPFLILWVVKNKKHVLLGSATILVGILIPFLINDRFMTTGLFLPISSVFLQVSYPYLFIYKYVNPLFLENVLRIIFFVLGLLITYKAIANPKHQNA